MFDGVPPGMNTSLIKFSTWRTKIKGKENHYRIRVGDYRVVYTPQDEKLIIRVIKMER